MRIIIFNAYHHLQCPLDADSGSQYLHRVGETDSIDFLDSRSSREYFGPAAVESTAFS